jgi:hypothetical protein
MCWRRLVEHAQGRRGAQEFDQRDHLAILDFEELGDLFGGVILGLYISNGGPPADGGLVAIDG